MAVNKLRIPTIAATHLCNHSISMWYSPRGSRPPNRPFSHNGHLSEQPYPLPLPRVKPPMPIKIKVTKREIRASRFVVFTF